MAAGVRAGLSTRAHTCTHVHTCAHSCQRGGILLWRSFMSNIGGKCSSVFVLLKQRSKDAEEAKEQKMEEPEIEAGHFL